VVLFLGGASGTVVSVTVPRNLLSVDETGIVIVQTAEDLDTLLGSDDAGSLLPEPDGQVFVKSGLYVEISVLTSTDGGVTFDELDETRLADHSVYIEMQGLEPSAGSSVSLYRHPVFVDSDPATGLMVLSQEGPWSTSGVHDLTVEGDWVHARLTSLSVIAPYEPFDESKTQLPAGCAGISLNETSSSGARPPHDRDAAGGDLLILSFSLLILLFGGGKAALRRARATQRP